LGLLSYFHAAGLAAHSDDAFENPFSASLVFLSFDCLLFFDKENPCFKRHDTTNDYLFNSSHKLWLGIFKRHLSFCFIKQET
jgi:3-deoxy-D-arabino-heptulosonate 7-phosphate (DAHP) synthase class II